MDHVFEVLILEAPTKQEQEEGKLERIVYGPKVVVAKDSFTATLDSVLDCKEPFDRARMVAKVRPF